MRRKITLMNRGLKGKILRLCVFLVLTASIVFAFIGIFQLQSFMHVVSETNASKSENIKTISEETLMELTRERMMNTITLSAKVSDGEFWTMHHDFSMLADQVKDVFEHPEAYGEREVSVPDKSNAGKYALQILFPDEEAAEDPETMRMVRKLANLEPLMREIVRGSDLYTRDCYISLPCGISLAMDTESDQKFDESGHILAYDPRVRPWYVAAVEKGGFCFTLAVQSYFVRLPEVEYGVPIYVDGELVAVLQGSTALSIIQEFMSDIGIGRNGFSILITDDDQLIFSPRQSGELLMPDGMSMDIRQTGNEQLVQLVEGARNQSRGFGEVEIDGEKYYAAYVRMDTVGWLQITFVLQSEMQEPTVALLKEVDAISVEAEEKFGHAFRNSTILILGVIFLLLLNAFVASLSLSGKLLNPINVMTHRIEDLSGKQFVFEMEDVYRTGDEIEVLAKTFGQLSNQTQEFIHRILTMTAEKERVSTELSIATTIQANMLPSVFPPFPDRHEFDLYASMHPAIEVGGDFYDFVMVDDDHLGLVIADVSDKGVPAALFMMSSKIIINYRLQLGGSPAEILKAANEQLCRNNKHLMFVTVWLGILELSTGKLICSNAGHEFPILRDPSGAFQVFRDKHSMPLGARLKTKFQDYELQLAPGSAVFVYTDGVPEAANAEGTFYGMERLTNTLNRLAVKRPAEILQGVKEDITAFVDGASQFDDMTMLCVEYCGKSPEKATETEPTADENTDKAGPTV
ncbi:MAG: SpoIIE family protein phosphatase [Clostridia bacterium]|nr:SpoIIE family protein phosphatase [Clostridia bacterium]